MKKVKRTLTLPQTPKKVKTPMTYVKENYPEVYKEILEKGIFEGGDREFEMQKYIKENPGSPMLGMKRNKKLTA
jgi:hypothetical protein